MAETSRADDQPSTSIWQIAIDTGGTFTDVLARDPTGGTHDAKVLSTGALRGEVSERVGPRSIRIQSEWQAPAGFLAGFQFALLGVAHEELRVGAFDPSTGLLELDGDAPEAIAEGAAFEVRSAESAPLLAIRLVTGTCPNEALPPLRLRLATTLGTNALLERRGAEVTLFTTSGFADLLQIGTQERPDLFALAVRQSAPLTHRVVEIEERIASDGEVVVPFDPGAVTPLIDAALESGARSAAIALLNAYRNPEHERALADLLAERGFEHISCSSELAPFIRMLPRTETAVVNAYLAPMLTKYLDEISRALPAGHLQVMTSAGGLVDHRAFHPKDGLLSGPAGGVAGAAHAGRNSGFERLVTFDMGGTSTDVARYAGDHEYVFEHRVGDAHLVAPALAVETVASGGGSICWLDGERLRVGPESAGAQPGPACYGAGGPLTVTDVNLLLGRLDPSSFAIPIRVEHAEAALGQLVEALEDTAGVEVEGEQVLTGLLDIVNDSMADAIRTVSIRKGLDPTADALVAFGGAGGQHAVAVAKSLGMETVVIPRAAGTLSAVGVGHAPVERFAERQILQPLYDVESKINGWLDELRDQAIAAVEKDAGGEPIAVRRRIAELRFLGQDTCLAIDEDEFVPLKRRFELRHEEAYGYIPDGRDIEVASLRVIASTVAPEIDHDGAVIIERPVRSAQTRSVFSDGSWRDLHVHDRSDLAHGDRIEGPALIRERHSTTFLPNAWSLHVDRADALVIRPIGLLAPEPSANLEAVKLELFTNRFRSIAVDMGAQLQHTAISTNIKERLDFSCAVLDRNGELVANAPHIPVHLGSLGLCVQRLRELAPLGPGDMIVTNHPRYGGSHLPDVTVVTPAHSLKGALIGYVASRAHHAEIGGIAPGSMPPGATSLEEEGVVIPPCYIVRGKVERWAGVRKRLGSLPYPSRAIDDNLADLRAAIAANKLGAAALGALAADVGEEVVTHYMEALAEHAESRMRSALMRLSEGRREAVEFLDDGSPIRVEFDIADAHATITFRGSAPVHDGSLNATPAIVRSAVLYVLRLLVDEELPLNDGLMRAVTLDIPPGMLNPPFPKSPAESPAIVGGNVETSQRVVDTLLKALGVAAGSQGTMNNVIFGTDRFGYYETVGGGSGATPLADGASAVHSHMTNTRITDPEVVEHRYPVRIQRFAIRRGSGGGGQRSGGDGAIREYLFLEPVSLSVISQRRNVGPYGVDGGSPGKPGRQRLVRSSGETTELRAIDSAEVEAGDRFIIETPGGGGYGESQT